MTPAPRKAPAPLTVGAHCLLHQYRNHGLGGAGPRVAAAAAEAEDRRGAGAGDLIVISVAAGKAAEVLAALDAVLDVVRVK